MNKKKSNEVYTWSKSNYFNHPSLSDEHLQNDLLCLIKELSKIEVVNGKEEIEKGE